MYLKEPGGWEPREAAPTDDTAWVMSPWFSALMVREVDHQLIRDDQSPEAWFNLKIRDKCISYKAFPNNQKYEICTNSNTHRVMIDTSVPDGHAR